MVVSVFPPTNEPFTSEELCASVMQSFKNQEACSVQATVT